MWAAAFVDGERAAQEPEGADGSDGQRADDGGGGQPVGQPVGQPAEKAAEEGRAEVSAVPAEGAPAPKRRRRSLGAKGDLEVAETKGQYELGYVPRLEA